MAETYDLHDDDELEPRGKDHLFLWTVFILLLIGMAFASWLGSFYIFGHPEKPRPYRILKKLGKIDPPRRFEVTAAPPGNFFNAQKLFEKYSRYSPLQLEQENEELMRDYIKNYRETKKVVPYITGRYEIIDSYELQKTDCFTSGVVALAASTDFPQVLLEHVFTCAPENVAGLRANLPAGLDMRLETSRDLAAVVHIERTTDGYLQFTAMPLLYGSWGVKGSVGGFSLEPPPGLNLDAGVPIIRGKARTDALKTYAEYRRTKRPPGEDPTRPGATPEPELVRVETVAPGTTVPPTGALPDVPVATPIPAIAATAGRGTPPRAATRTPATPTQVAMLNNTPRPVMPVATPMPIATPLPVASATKVPIKPFISSAPPTDFTAASSQNWRVYNPGKQPPGRTVSASEASSLAERGELTQRMYLRGNFIVTAAGDSRAVLRAQGGSGDPSRPGSSAARVIAEFPPSIAPPEEGSTFARDDSRAFEIKDVRRGADGQINIYVREITSPE